MADILTELQQKVAMKPALEAKLRELQNQRREMTQRSFFSGLHSERNRKMYLYRTAKIFREYLVGV